MVARSRGVITQSAHGPQLRRPGGVEGLDQRADGEVSPVQGKSIRVEGPLLLQCGGQPGIAPGLPAVRPLQGQEVGVEIMGKEHRGLVGPRGRLRQTPGNQQGQQEKRCEHSGHSPPQPPHETSLLSVCSRHSAKTALQDFILP